MRSLENMLEDAKRDRGSEWMSLADMIRFCAFLEEKDYGVCLMSIETFEGTREYDHRYLIDGRDGSETWENHRDPARSIRLARKKLNQARADGLASRYRVWVVKGGLPDNATLLAQAESGAGTDWLTVPELEAFCVFVLEAGYGVQTMEAIGNGARVPRKGGYEILGVEGEETWENHRDPKRSIDLVRETVRNAQSEGHEMLYKVWVQNP